MSEHDAGPARERRRPGHWILAGLLVLTVAFGAGLLSGRRSARAPASPGAVDIGFCQSMSVHHAQAVLMAQEAVDRSRTPAIRLIARQILATQTQERGTMAGWLTLWNAPQLPSGPPMAWMAMSSSSTETDTRTPHGRMAPTMPGMATQADLGRLASADGKRFDVLFLQLMVRHHTGGIGMAIDAREHARLSAVRALAGAMAIHQAQENALMGQLLSARGAKPLPLTWPGPAPATRRWSCPPR
ncbi:DUF305 domain-containing protein [Actinoallomurus acaciae]|uniref:DUF305 domain-containing protein n=1 Tax=Actinoallomurus acaciae TaxID=502577 RepID=A0ABV5YKK8_9ACTN